MYHKDNEHVSFNKMLKTKVKAKVLWLATYGCAVRKPDPTLNQTKSVSDPSELKPGSRTMDRLMNAILFILRKV